MILAVQFVLTFVDSRVRIAMAGIHALFAICARIGVAQKESVQVLEAGGVSAAPGIFCRLTINY